MRGRRSEWRVCARGGVGGWHWGVPGGIRAKSRRRTPAQRASGLHANSRQSLPFEGKFEIIIRISG